VKQKKAEQMCLLAQFFEYLIYIFPMNGFREVSVILLGPVRES